MNGVETKLGWKCIYSGYHEQQGIKIISKAESIKIFPDHELTYFSSDQIKVTYY